MAKKLNEIENVKRVSKDYKYLVKNESRIIDNTKIFEERFVYLLLRLFVLE
jgi:hypothetical protein